MIKIFKKEPWFYSRRFLADNLNLIVGDVVNAGKARYKGLILSSPGVNSYIEVEANLNEKFPLESNKFDTAICIDMLEHLLEPQNALNEIARILKPNGYLFLSTLWNYPYHGRSGDYFRYSGDCLKYLLSKAGFETISIFSGAGKMGILFTFLAEWTPFLKKLSPIIDKFLSLFPPKKLLKDTTNYQIIAKKK